MTSPSPGNSITFRVEVDGARVSTAELATVVAATGAEVTGFDTVESSHVGTVVDVTCNTIGPDHADRIQEVLDAREGLRVRHLSDRTFLMHLGGKLAVAPTITLRNRDDLSRAYTPGVARVCRAIARNPEDARHLTIKRNTVAVVTDGTAVLGLGDIGPAAALPVMEGKAALFKQFAGVDAWPVCLDTTDTEQIIAIVKAIAPSYGGVNLEDVSAPRCFEIERRLRAELDIPVFHDDQHGTAVVVLAALINALRVVEKKIGDVRVVVSGVGAAGHAVIQLLHAQGARDIVACNRHGAIHAGQDHEHGHLAWLAQHTNPAGRTGTLKEVLAGADVFVGLSAPDLLDGDDIATMADGAVVMALSNPDPEVRPREAAAHAAVVATGRSDFPNQINNVLAFPGLFRGLLDAGAREIDTAMLVAAATAIADCVSSDELTPGHIIPSVFDGRVAPAVAAGVKAAAGARGDTAV